MSEQLRIKGKKSFDYGYTTVVKEDKDILMEFGILKLKAAQSYKSCEDKERVFLLMTGKADVYLENTKFTLARESLLYENPHCVHVPQNIFLKIDAFDETEIAIIKTENLNNFSYEYYSPSQVRSEARGQGTMMETSTRIVRTIFDNSDSPKANLVVGEVIDYPGKWSSYPPHYHRQPEIYHYRIFPEEGFGISIIGEEAFIVKNNDTVKILNNKVHPQVSAPGYAMYYIWVIRHLDKDPYIDPIFEKKHLWVITEENNIYPNKKY
jgi:5-deoxy-glucuronate isomerase